MKNTKTVGSLIPSSKYLAKLISVIAELHTKDKGSILEIGAGTGYVSKYLIDILGKRKLTSLEINDDFYEILQEKFAKDNIKISKDNFLVDNISERFDTIVCCLPLNNFSQKENDLITEKMKTLLKDKGTIIYFEYILISDLRNLFKFNDIDLNVIHKESVLLNFPPARVIVIKKDLEK